MSKIREALKVYESLRENDCRAFMSLLLEERDKITKDPESLLRLVRKKGGKSWIYGTYDNFSEEQLTAIRANRVKLSIPIEVEGFEGCHIKLMVTTCSVYSIVEYLV